uniref:NADH-ubiquinone oxidoreductase chain 3 n=1 Tax=Pseudoneureclipsis sibuyana TaxID=2904893 RepID=A0A9E8LQ34_9NEOP|nr:NADH dehydrogenase subunit 3 [Pseudoneureclipsis sibuyana]UZZ44292.1 NADH dehydrogenase subunit 3 [Pseudoneureclipsis sibuyana]
MMSILTSMTAFIIIATMMMAISLSIFKKYKTNREMNSPFECGFDPKTMNRSPFSIHFFLITILFLIFDIEITLILPFIINTNLSSFMYINFMMNSIFTILILGLIHEWNLGILNWKL